jgi:hypothetical protein
LTAIPTGKLTVLTDALTAIPIARPVVLAGPLTATLASGLTR